MVLFQNRLSSEVVSKALEKSVLWDEPKLSMGAIQVLIWHFGK